MNPTNFKIQNLEKNETKNSVDYYSTSTKVTGTKVTGTKVVDTNIKGYCSKCLSPQYYGTYNECSKCGHQYYLPITPNHVSEL